jgi:hypothetical protein
LLKPEKLRIDRLARDQRQLDVRPEHDCHVVVVNHTKKRYIRRGSNRNSGTAQRDSFILRRDGTIEGNIDWDYKTVSRVDARPIDTKRLVLRGGVFTTIANRMQQEVGSEGNVAIRNCRWIPACGSASRPQMFYVGNDGTHDFGYDCSMPREITIDGLDVDDSNHPQDYTGLFFLSNPGGSDPADSPFPYARCQKLTVRGLTTASGKKPHVSSNAQVAKSVVLVEQSPSSPPKLPPKPNFLP